MSLISSNPISRRNLFLTFAGILLLLAFLNSPAILTCLLTTKGLVATACIVGAGFFAAKGIREFAYVFLRGPGVPWYVKPGTFVFLFLILMGINIAANMASSFAFDAFQMAHIIPKRSLILEFMGMEFLWIVILDWPSNPNPGIRKPNFKRFNKLQKDKTRNPLT